MIERKNIEAYFGAATLVLLVFGCFLVIKPFITAIVWSAIFVYVTHKPYRKLKILLGNRGWLAAVLFVLVTLLLVVVPLLLITWQMTEIATSLTTYFNQQFSAGAIRLPDWLAHLPLLGSKLEVWWGNLLSGDSSTREQISHFMMQSSGLFMHWAVEAMHDVILLVFSCILAIFFYAGMDDISFFFKRGVHLVSGSRADHLIKVAGETVNGVVVGILGSAIIQGILIGFSLSIAGVPAALSLTLLAVLLSFIPGGVALIWIPSALWLHHEGHNTWMWFVIIWGGILVNIADHIIKPILIGRGGHLPFVLIMLGVLGGAISFGLLGVFLGPVLLAVGFALLRDFVTITT